MRNLKKFLAVIMTVAMIASLMVPALAAGSNEDEAEALKTIGLFKGTSDTDLALERPLTRDQGVTLVVRILGKEDEALALSEEEISAELAKMADAAAIPGWARPYVAFALKEKIAHGVGHNGVTSFDAAAPMTGKHFTTLVLRALGYADADYNNPWDTAVEAGVLTAGQTITLAKDSIIRDDAVAALYGAVKNGVLADGKTKLLDKLIADKAVDEDAAREAGFITTPEKLEVEDVEALNLKQIEVTYNGAEFDEDAIKDKGNYSFENADEDDVDIVDASLDGDVVVLTLDLAEPGDNQSTGKLTVSDEILDKEETFDVEFFDTTIPTVEGAEVVGNDTIKVKFSEPIDFGEIDEDGYADEEDAEDAFSLNDGEFFVKSVKPLSNNTEANVEFYTEFESDEYTLSVDNDLEDYAGFNVVPEDIKLEVVKDEDAPEIVGYKDVSPLGITLIFNEDVEPADGSDEYDEGEDGKFFHTNSKNYAEKAVAGDAGNEIDLTFDEANQLPNGTAYVYVDDEAVQDLWDNVNDQRLSIAVEVTVDDNPPEVTEIEATEYKVTLTFNEVLDETTADDDDNYTILDDDGDEVDFDKATSKEDDDGNLVKVVITAYSDSLFSGDNTLKIENVEDVYGNAIDELTLEFTAKDDSAPTFDDVTATLYDESEDDKVQTLIIDFGEPMNTAGKYSIVDLDNYQYDDIIDLSDVDDSYINIKAIDGNKKVKIDLEKDNDALATDSNEEADLVFVSGSEIDIARVADAAGHPTQEISGSIEILDGYDAVNNIKAKTVEATAKDKLVLTLDGKVSKFDAKDFDVLPSGIEIVGARLDNSGDDSVITFTLDDELTTIGPNGKINDEDVRLITVGADGAAEKTVNEYGVPVEIGTTSPEGIVKDKIAPAIAKVDDPKSSDPDDKIDDVNVTQATTGTSITLTFNEAIDTKTVSKYTFEVGDFGVDSVEFDGTPDDGSKTVTLHLNSEDVGDAEEEDIIGTSVTQKYTIYDANGNKLEDLNVDVTY